MNPNTSNILELKNISKSFSGSKVLDGISLEIQKGEVHALLGENGAGKSTLIKIILGALNKNSGEVFFDGQRKSYISTREAHIDGMAGIFQETSLVPQLTVLENVFLGNEITGPNQILNPKKMLNEFSETCKWLGLKLDPNQQVARLSVADKKLAEIVKAFIKNSRFIIMDEPTDSLPQMEIEHLLSVIGDLKIRKTSILYVTHKMDEVFHISDRISILRDGRKVETLKTSETSPPEVISLMIGPIQPFTPKQKKSSQTHASPILRTVGLNLSGILSNVSFSVYPGEILALTGLIGAGKTQIARILFGIDLPDSGEMYYEGDRFIPSSPREAIERRIFLVPEDRQTQGLFLDLEIYKNISITALDQVQTTFGLSKQKEISLAKKISDQLNLKSTNLHVPAKHLSGGNQQKAVLAKWIHRQPKVFILDEPTQGIDVGAKEEVFKIIRQMANENCAILYISSEFSQVERIADRVLIVHEGKILKEFTEGVSQKQMMATILNFEDQKKENC